MVNYTVQSSLDPSTHVNDPDMTSVTTDAARTTAFVENTNVVSTRYPTADTYDNLEEKYTSIKDFLGKPYLVTTVNWTSAAAAGSNIWSVATESYFNGGGSNITAWTDKLKGFNLVRGTLHFRFEVTANRFQQGYLIGSFMPNASRLGSAKTGSHRATINGIFQLPHVVINASDSAAEITIPYIAPTSHFDLKTFRYSWGSAWLDVVSPLQSGALGENSARVLIYAWLTDVELTAPLVPQMDTSETRGGPISKTLNDVSKVAGSFKKVPLVRQIATDVSWATRVAAGVASAFGFSKPTNELQNQIVARQQWRYSGVSDGASSALPFGLTHDTSLRPSSHSLRNEDEMSLKFLYSIPNYCGLYTWTTGDVPGTVLTSIGINPSLLGLSGSTTYAGHTASWFQGAPVVYLSQFFNLWRGSFKLRLKIVKTEMHKGRIQITWTPTQTTPITAPTIQSSIFSQRHIIDLAEKDTIVLNLPYLINTPYLNVHNSRNDPVEGLGLYSGLLDIKTLNELRCPETCAQEVKVILWIEPGEDFEYAAPGNSSFNLGPGPATAATVPFILQMDVGDDDRDVLTSEGIGGSRIVPKRIDESAMCVGEHILSIKQLMLRFAPVYAPGGYPGNSSSFSVWPYFGGEYTINNATGALVKPVLTGDPLSYFKPCYAYYRGAVRISLSPNATTTPTNIGVSLTPGLVPGSGAVAGTYSGTNNSIASVDPSTQNINLGTSITESEYGLGLVSANVPYYCRTPVSLTTVSTATVPINNTDCPLSVVNFVNNSGTITPLSNSVLYRSVGDDFQLLYFLSCPPIMYGYA